MLDKNDSIVSNAYKTPNMKNSKAKNIRNFNCLYEGRLQSDKLKEMQEKYRIGDG